MSNATATVTHNPRNVQGEIAVVVSEGRHAIVKALNAIDHHAGGTAIKAALADVAVMLDDLDAKVRETESGE